MIVVLSEDVKNIGKKGDIVQVADGYGRNFLLPRNLAQLGTPQAIAEAQKNKSEKEIAIDQKNEHFIAQKQKVESLKLEVQIKSGKDGAVFGSIGVKEIYTALDEKGVELEKNMIQLNSPIKTLGWSSVSIKFTSTIVANLEIHVAPKTN